MPIKLRRKRYAAVVVSLHTLVFGGVGAVVSMMTLTTFSRSSDHVSELG
jgi:hypothetical protein